MTEISRLYPGTSRWRFMDELKVSLERRLSNWRARSKLRTMEQLDDRMLDDIGVTRADLTWAAHLPTTVNPVEELTCRTTARRA